MESAFLKLIENAPWAAVMIWIVRMFLQAEKEREVKRSADAAETNTKQREHDVQMEQIRHGRELEINNLWASTVKNMMTTQDATSKEIASVLADLKTTIVEQYKNLGITQDLYKMAKENLNHRERMQEKKSSGSLPVKET
jgi:hypothetical protein